MTFDPADTRVTRRGALTVAGATLFGSAGCLGLLDSDPPAAYHTPAAEAFDGVVDAAWLADHLDDVILLDVRDEDDFADARIPGARHYPQGELLTEHVSETADGFEADLEYLVWLLEDAGIDPDDDVVVYGQEANLWETYAVYTLRAIGHQGTVALLDGGFSVWDAANEDTTGARPDVDGTTYDPALQFDEIATRDFVAEHVTQTEATTPIIDMRSSEEYWGTEPTDGVERHGHVTGAINVDFRQSIDDEAGRLRSPDELEALWFDTAGLSRDETVIPYCLTAIRASVGWFLLTELGVEDVRNYEGSWMDWGNLSDEDGYYYTSGEDSGTVVDAY